jgi:NADPH:quinone reductase-like Zn-dependent oxidoreductase
LVLAVPEGRRTRYELANPVWRTRSTTSCTSCWPAKPAATEASVSKLTQRLAECRSAGHAEFGEEILNMTTMTALRAHHRGGPEVLVVEQAAMPVPAPGEVLIAVHAAAITFDELTWEETWERDGVSRTPTIPSHEVSGVVALVGDSVVDIATGDEVYGLIRFDRDGAAAEYVAVPAADLAPRPRTVSHTVSAALPLAGLTAWQALVNHAAVQPGERVLVHGGAGGVGALTVQLAAALGADVTTTVRSDDARDAATGFGARHVIDTRIQQFDGPDAVYDVVIDTVGGQTLDRSFEVLRPGGRLVTLSAPPPAGKADAFEIDATFFIVVPDRQQLARLAELVDASRLHVAIAGTFPLADGRAAFESGRQPHRRPGKTVITVRD